MSKGEQRRDAVVDRLRRLPGRGRRWMGALVFVVVPLLLGSLGLAAAASDAGAPGASASYAGDLVHAGRSAVRAAGSWSWPVDPHAVSGPYAAPATRYAAGHRGIDLEASSGVVVSAPADAVVRFSGVVVDRPVLTLDHGGVLSSYEPVASELVPGTSVARGAIVGTVAAGGHCAEACLHVGVRVDGEYVSPLLFFARVPPAVLLPLGGP
ncbi:murein hydrolase activator EnvC family protein [Leifsonia sp. 22587]|uniref:murein hydrolase activator EnvC family protein n=1 Tax=Leifsonia sp. 22587 TaxID=3453946 RepID=UPI003F879A0F